MNNDRFNVLKRLFEIVKNIDKSSKAVAEMLPVTNASIYFCSEVVPTASQFILGRYIIMLHSDYSLFGKYNVMSIRNEIYVNGQLNLEKSRSYYISIPRLLLAVIEIIQDPTDEDMKNLSKQILSILSTTHAVSNSNISYSSALSVNIRHSLSDLKALRESIKIMVAQEQNLYFTINDEEKFSKSVFSMMTCNENLLSQSAINYK